MSDESDVAAAYPGLIEPEYCLHCTLPLAFCEFGPCFAKCLATLEASRPQIVEQFYSGVDLAASLKRSLKLSADNPEGSSAASASADPSAEAAVVPGKRFAKVTKKSPAKVVVEVSDRGRKKRITTIIGLQHFVDEKLKDISRALAKKFACSCTIAKGAAGDEQIQLQGDVAWDIVEYLDEKYGVKEKSIDVKRV